MASAATGGEATLPPGSPISLTIIETHGSVPIYHLEYSSPLVLDRRRHEEELAALAALPEPRFALVVNCRNISVSADYSAKEQVEVHQSALMHALRDRVAAAARYRPGSLTSMIRTMIVGLYARQGTVSGYAPDLESALRIVRRKLEQPEEVEGQAKPASTPFHV
jgi:hypothetical protein